MMRRSVAARGGGGGIADKMFPGYKEKIWAAMPKGVKEFKVKSENDGFEKAISQHKSWQKMLLQYKATEAGMAPSAKYRKPAVDWRRQMERGTMHYGRWYEGPGGSDYRPGNTVDRLENVKAPFTDAEWEERKQFRSFDIMRFGYACLGIFLAYRLTNEWPVVWCDDSVEEKAETAKPKESKAVSGCKGDPAVGLGVELQALPAERFEGFFEPNDKGRVSSEPYVGDDGRERFKVTWYRTGKTSVRVAETWQNGFKIVGEPVQPALGDELEALPLEKFEAYFDPGDRGRVSSEPFVDEKDGKTKFKVTWYRTGKTSQRVVDSWMAGFRLVGKARQPAIGDELQALPLENFNDYFTAGDKGKVSTDHFVDPKDGKLKFKITWYRTGKTSTRVAEGWMRGFRLSCD
jgi:hypothetical protein